MTGIDETRGMYVAKLIGLLEHGKDDVELEQRIERLLSDWRWESLLNRKVTLEAELAGVNRQLDSATREPQ